MQYYVHPIVDVPTMDTEVLSLEKLGLNMQNYKYAGFDSMWNITRIELSTYLQSKCSHVDLNIYS